jgi:hypothetical protein
VCACVGGGGADGQKIRGKNMCSGILCAGQNSVHYF